MRNRRMTLLIASSLAALVCLGFSLWMAGKIARSMSLAKASVTWPSTTGTVLNSHVTVVRRGNPDRPDRYTKHLTYQYTVEGATHQSSQYTVGDALAPEDWETLATGLPAGTEVLVSYDPANPAQAVLVPGVTTAHRVGRFVPVLAFVLFAIFSGVFVQICRGRII